jgi:hypothetical protein
MRLLPGREGDVIVAYHIGLPDLWDIEIQPQGDAFFFIFWNEKDEVVRARELTEDEIAFLPHSEVHMDRVFDLLKRGSKEVVALLEKASNDAARTAERLRRIGKAHDRHLEALRKIAPGFPPDPHVRAATTLSERLEDVFETARVVIGIVKVTERHRPEPQASSKRDGQ